MWAQNESPLLICNLVADCGGKIDLLTYSFQETAAQVNRTVGQG